MTNQIKIALVGFIMLLIMVMVWFMGGNETKSPQTRSPFVSDDWEEQYKLNDKRPYGLFLFNSLLKAHIDSTKKIKPILDGIKLDSTIGSNATMVFVGDQFGLQNNELDTILAKVEKGNDLFLSFNELTENINERLFDSVEISYDYADSVNVFVGKNRLSQYYMYQNDTLAYKWKAFYEIDPKDSVYHTLSSFMEMTNFVRIKHGKGFIYLHTNPEFFFNYQLKREDGYRYTSFVLNQLAKDKDIYLLELGRLIDNKGVEEEYFEEEGPGGKEDDSYLQFLLKSPALIAAMGLSVLGLLLFLIFRAKRMQPTVAFIPKKKNMSMEFADTITSIYLAKQYPYGLLQLQKKNFYDVVYKHFFIDLSKNRDDREKELMVLSQKSNVPMEELIALLRLLETKVKINVTDEYIVETAKKQRKFYEQTGVIHTQILQKIAEMKGTLSREIFLSSLIILIGLFVILTGFYFLVKAIGVGIILWPLGALILTIGILRLSKPLLKYDPRTVIYYPLFGKKQEFKMNDLMNVAPIKNGAILNFTEQRTITIYYWQMSRFDKGQFEQLIAKKHQFEV